MTNHHQKYYITKTCKNCGNDDNIYLTKRQRAFELYDFDEIQKLNCTVCQSTEYISVGSSPLELDKELLLEWSFESNLHLMPQDEELLLAEDKYVDIILDIIDHYNILELKKIKLIEALCIFIYDNIVGNIPDNETLSKNEVLVDRVANELIKRKHLVLKSDQWIREYVKDIVYPKIGLTQNGS